MRVELKLMRSEDVAEVNWEAMGVNPENLKGKKVPKRRLVWASEIEYIEESTPQRYRVKFYTSSAEYVAFGKYEDIRNAILEADKGSSEGSRASAEEEEEDE
jgi:hypothetical protein